MKPETRGKVFLTAATRRRHLGFAGRSLRRYRLGHTYWNAERRGRQFDIGHSKNRQPRVFPIVGQLTANVSKAFVFAEDAESLPH